MYFESWFCMSSASWDSGNGHNGRSLSLNKIQRNLFVNLKYLRFRLSLSVIGLMVIPRLSPNCHSTDHTQTQAEPEHSESTFITTRKRSLRRLCFHRCVSVCPRGVTAPDRCHYLFEPGLLNNIR